MTANQPVKLHLKLHQAAGPDARREVEAAVESRGGSVRAIFPDDPDADLASLYVAEVPADTAGEGLLGVLRKLVAVEFAEEEPRRRPTG